MKRQTIYKYCICFFCAVIILSLFYMLSYYIASKSFDKQLSEYKQQEQNRLAEQTKQQQDPDQAAAGDPQSVEAGTPVKATVTPETQYCLEVYDIQNDMLNEYKLNPPAYLVGLNRDELVKYIEGYMAELPLDEFQMGLVAYDIISFSGEKVVLRKSYDQSTVPYQYYLAVDKGFLVVYYADKNTVFEYTGIDVTLLPEEDQRKLAYGIFIQNQEELYGMLEGYSS